MPAFLRLQSTMQYSPKLDHATHALKSKPIIGTIYWCIASDQQENLDDCHEKNTLSLQAILTNKRTCSAPCTMKICIVGAGFAGLSTAKVLRTFGHQVRVFEKQADVGGVWSASRRYPGLTTQNGRSTYVLSDFPYPGDYPEWPTGEQVQCYLDNYTQHFQFAHCISLNTEVIATEQHTDGWTVHTRHANGNTASENFDYLIVCNGVFSQPLIPDYPGESAFIKAGGRLCHTSEFHRLAQVARKHVLIVGYGKSSCDIAQTIAETGSAASITVVARHLLWKVPKRFLGVLNYKYLLLGRLGEGLFKFIHVSGFERFLHGTGKPLRDGLLGLVQGIICKQCRLDELGLKPALPFETIARSTVSLASDGFFQNVMDGKIRVAKLTSVAELSGTAEGGYARLTDGRLLRADIIICGTGWQQSVPFLEQHVLQQLTDAAGNFRLYRQMLPVGVPRLAFNGYNSSLMCQLNAEIGALWLADLLGGELQLPSESEQRQIVSERLAWMEVHSDGQHAKGASIIPFSIHHVDELLRDMRLPLSSLIRLKQWLLPIDPSDFAVVTRQLCRRYDIKNRNSEACES